MSPFFTQFWKELPPMGGISIHHRAWYFLRNEHDVGDPDEAAEWYNVPFHEINDFERTLYLGGYRIIKLFTHISQKQQEKNIAKDKDSLGSRWEALTPAGIEGVDYKAYRNVYEKMLTETNTVYAPWHVIPMEDVRTGILETMDVLISEFKAALSAAETQKKARRHRCPMLPIPPSRPSWRAMTAIRIWTRRPMMKSLKIPETAGRASGGTCQTENQYGCGF